MSPFLHLSVRSDTKLVFSKPNTHSLLYLSLEISQTSLRPLHLPFALPLLYLSLRIPDDKVEVGNIKSNSKLRLVLPEGSTSISWGP